MKLQPHKRYSKTLMKCLSGSTVLLFCFSVLQAEMINLRQWKFYKGDVPGAEASSFDDSEWRDVRIPHDWSIEGTPAPDSPSEGGNGFFPMGIGWYRTSFVFAESVEDRVIDIVFDGVYRNAEVWINGQKLGSHAYGYTQFRFDLTPHLLQSERNVIAVRVDNSAQPNSRWYSGSGIYRSVWLELKEKVHFEPYSLFVQTLSVSKAEAELLVKGSIVNQTDDLVEGPVKIELGIVNGARYSFATESMQVEAHASKDFSLNCRISNPRLWSPETPTLYALTATIQTSSGTLSTYSQEIGIRTVKVSSEYGLELNGKPILLLGGNVHHDHGPLGAAAYPEAERRKVAILKAAGYNAVRTSHNPPSSEFLNECDRQGLLVLDEAFDMWKAPKLAHDHSEEWDESWIDDIRSMVLRDRNHPSVVMWSVGNEVYERTSADGLRRGHMLAAEVRAYDPTRPVTIGLNGAGKNGKWSDLDGIFAAFDVTGYNYELQRYQEDHERLPNRVIFASESYQNEAYRNWSIMQDASWVIGDFVWSAIDYLGEAAIGKVFNPDEEVVPHWEGNHYPWHGAYCGDIDLTGWRKPVSHYRQIIWDKGESLYAAVEIPAPNAGEWNLSQWSVTPMLPVWEWPEYEDQPVKLTVFSRYDAIKVRVNGHLVAKEKGLRESEFKTEIEIPYETGQIKITAYEDGDETESIELFTPGAPARFQWVNKADYRSSDELVFIELQLLDSEGRWVMRSDVNLELEVSDSGEILGIATGNLTTTEGYQVTKMKTSQGRALVVVRKLDSNQRKPVYLQVKSDGIPPISLKF